MWVCGCVLCVHNSQIHNSYVSSGSSWFNIVCNLSFLNRTIVVLPHILIWAKDQIKLLHQETFILIENFLFAVNTKHQQYGVSLKFYTNYILTLTVAIGMNVRLSRKTVNLIPVEWTRELEKTDKMLGLFQIRVIAFITYILNTCLDKFRIIHFSTWRTHI